MVNSIRERREMRDRCCHAVVVVLFASVSS